MQKNKTNYARVGECPSHQCRNCSEFFNSNRERKHWENDLRKVIKDYSWESKDGVVIKVKDALSLLESE